MPPHPNFTPMPPLPIVVLDVEVGLVLDQYPCNFGLASARGPVQRRFPVAGRAMGTQKGRRKRGARRTAPSKGRWHARRAAWVGWWYIIVIMYIIIYILFIDASIIRSLCAIYSARLILPYQPLHTAPTHQIGMVFWMSSRACM